jgi:hypothetical protein
MSFAVDANILLYASDSESLHHKQARSFLEECIKQRELFLYWLADRNELSTDRHSPICFRPAVKTR